MSRLQQPQTIQTSLPQEHQALPSDPEQLLNAQLHEQVNLEASCTAPVDKAPIAEIKGTLSISF